VIHGLHQRLNAALIDPGFAAHDAANGVAQLRGRAGLEKNSAHAETESAHTIGIRHAGGDDQNAAGISGGARLADEVKSIFIAQIEIQQHQIHARAGEFGKRLVASGTLPGKFEIGFGGQQAAEAGAKQTTNSDLRIPNSDFAAERSDAPYRFTMAIISG